MALEVEATYEDGVLKLDQPLPLKEQERVRVTVHAKVSRVRASYGLMQCGHLDPRDVDYLVNDPDNHPWADQ